MRKPISLTAAALLTAGVLAGCGAPLETFNDAPRAGTVNDVPAEVGTMPDGFSNYASKCDGPNRVYVLYHGTAGYGALAVVANDPRCVNEPTP